MQTKRQSSVRWKWRTLQYKSLFLLASFAVPSFGADMTGSRDPAGIKRYAGSELIGFREPKFDEFELPLGPPVGASFAFEKSLKTEGLVSRYTYIAPAGRSPAELFQNYKLEFKRVGLKALYTKEAGERGWFGPTLEQIAEEDQLGQILGYNEDQERVLVAKSSGKAPTYYYVFVTAYADGVIPERLQHAVAKDRALAEVVVISPKQLEDNMAFVSAEDMSQSLASTGKVALYGLYFDTDKEELRLDSQPAVNEIAKLLQSQPRLNIHVVGHSDNQGKVDYNLDLSRRRAASVVRELVTKYSIAANRLDSFGCGLYSPVNLNDSEDGRAKNRRVELVKW